MLCIPRYCVDNLKYIAVSVVIKFLQLYNALLCLLPGIIFRSSEVPGAT